MRMVSLAVLIGLLFEAVPTLQSPPSSSPSPPASQSAEPGIIRGTVVDTEGGTPIVDVSVRVQSTGTTTVTDAAGHFELTGLLPGEHELYVSVVNFVLVTRRVHVGEGDVTEVTLALTQGTGTYTETVSVVAAAAEPRRAVAESLVRGIQLQELSGLLANDPLRAVQAMPGVTAGDDFRSDFAVRGAGPLQTGFVFEGMASPFLLHTVQQVSDAGSIAMINGEVVDSVALRAGSYPQHYGDRTGAEVEFQMREGSRDRARAHVTVSAVDASGVAEGPLGASRRGSWLVSARRSYLDMVLKRLYDNQSVNFGFTDVQTKLVHDLGANQRVEFAATIGRSRLDLEPDEVSNPNNLREATNESALGVASWRYTPSSRITTVHRLGAVANTFRNISEDDIALDDGSARDLMYRGEWTQTFSPRVTIDAATEFRWTHSAGSDRRLSGGRLVSRELFDVDGSRAGSFVSLRLIRGPLTLTPGLRVDRWSEVTALRASPWLQAAWPLSSHVTIAGGVGVYRQAPRDSMVEGVRGTRALGLADATQADVSVEGAVRGTMHWKVTAYDREEQGVWRLPGSEARLSNNLLLLPSTSTKWANALDGHARGVEWLLERRSSSGIGGWLSYAYAKARQSDRLTGEHFWGDYDQRHTLNAFATYRMSDRTSLSLRFRAGSNTPAIGYWEERGGRYFVSAARNNLRIPAYSRLDLRANRTFTKRHGRLTLHLEVLNVLANDNVRFVPPSVNRTTQEAFGVFESVLPLVPSAGLLIEF